MSRTLNLLIEQMKVVKRDYKNLGVSILVNPEGCESRHLIVVTNVDSEKRREISNAVIDVKLDVKHETGIPIEFHLSEDCHVGSTIVHNYRLLATF